MLGVATDLQILSVVFTAISILLAGVWKLVTFITKKLDHLDGRIGNLEKIAVEKVHLDGEISGIYNQINENFKQVNERMDVMYQLLVQLVAHKSKD